VRPAIAIKSLLALAGALLVGCAGAEPTDEDVDADGAALSAARADSAAAFEAQLADLERRYASSAEGGATVAPASLRPLGGRLGPVSRKLCDHLAPFSQLEHAYFYYGGYVGADVVVGAQTGMDFVYDLWNRQAAVFSWKAATANLGTAGAIEVGGYVGYGFGAKSNVLDAWAGRFDAVDVSVDIPLTKLGIEASGFRSPDGSIVGGSVGAAAGLAISWPLPVTGSLETGFWVPFDAGTRSLNAVAHGARRSLKRAPALSGDPRIKSSAKPRDYDYVQFERSSDLALGLLWSAPAGVALVPAAQAVAIGVLRDSGRTIEQLCPRRP